MVVVAIASAVLVLPVITAAILWGIIWSPYRARRIAQQHVADARDVRGDERHRSLEVVHPYLGFVLNPAATQDDWRSSGWEPPVVNVFGFESPAQLLGPPGDAMRIGIVGGSVAKAFANGVGGQSVSNELSSHFGRKVEVVCLAVGGYKAPQQLMAVAYALTLGAALDAVINVDGFNDVALYPAEGVRSGMCPSFPRSWYGRTPSVTSRRAALLMVRSAELRGWRRRIAEIASGVARFAPLTFVIAELADRILSHSIERTDTEVQADRVDVAKLNGGTLRGEPVELADLWHRTSYALHSLCAGANIRYFHFLQPNQYDRGSKVLSSDELERAYVPNHPYEKAVLDGYPELRRRVPLLKTAGVQCHDLSQLFATERATTYIDTCCHFNDFGNLKLAAEIAHRAYEGWW